MQQIEKMKNLVTSLPTKDRKMALSFIQNRKFEDLWQLVASDIYKIKRDPDQYTDANYDDLHIFRAEITSYLEQLGLNDEDSLEDDELIIDDYEEF